MRRRAATVSKPPGRLRDRSTASRYKPSALAGCARVVEADREVVGVIRVAAVETVRGEIRLLRLGPA